MTLARARARASGRPITETADVGTSVGRGLGWSPANAGAGGCLTVCSAGEVRQVELDLVPAVVQAQGHGADEGLDPGSGLVVGRAEAAPHVLVVQHLHLEAEVLLHVFHLHTRSQPALGAEGGAHSMSDVWSIL